MTHSRLAAFAAALACGAVLSPSCTDDYAPFTERQKSRGFEAAAAVDVSELPRLVTEIYDNSPPSGSPGVLVGFIAGTGADRFGALPEAERRAGVLACFAGYFGPRALAATTYVERDWRTEEWTRGAYSPTFAVGGLHRFGAVLAAPLGPLRFASADIPGEGMMHMDGAVRTGAAAAASLLDAQRSASVM